LQLKLEAQRFSVSPFHFVLRNKTQFKSPSMPFLVLIKTYRSDRLGSVSANIYTELLPVSRGCLLTTDSATATKQQRLLQLRQ
ncbi:MAG: hypothetical protein AB8A37_09940, partial [Prochlorococcus sp.]